MTVRRPTVQIESRHRRVLSIQRCRTILGAGANKSDSEIEQLRDQLYTIARVWIDGGAKMVRSPSMEFLASLPKHDRCEIEERAAVMEFDGGLSRPEAERTAIAAFMRHQEKGIH